MILAWTVFVILVILSVAIVILPPPGDELFLVPELWLGARKLLGG